MFYLGTMFYVSLLLVNALAVLSEERFLARIGWTSSPAQNAQPGFHQPYESYGGGGGQQAESFKGKLVNLIGAVRTLMRVPLIFVNVGVIFWELAFGK
ncbi:Yos1-like protein [Rickenella mellea]|uniref:Yos1-like protein n=1 Tax=Rickenella mellea TaxID=50990 RepID=A0A4R5XFJ6_9AGAM|nr:Yos1-like protein [Rickenella mellea]